MRGSNDAAVNWFVGVVVSLALAAYGLWVLASGRVIVRGRYGGALSLTGFDAMLYGICVLALAVTIHVFSAWPRIDRLADYTGPAAGTALVVFVGLLAALLARQFLNFI